MITLYQREACEECARVRQALEDQHLTFESVPVAKLPSERRELAALQAGPLEVPVLVEDGRAFRGTEAILRYLAARPGRSFYGEPSYGYTRRLTGYAFGDVVAATRTALGQEGFGVLTEIDVKATMKKKLDLDYPNYLILGACNPPIAHRALSAEPGIGLLLPCNVVVTEEEGGTVVVSAIDPLRMFAVIDRPEIAPVATEVAERLRRVLAAIGTG